jgi:hypothetical protein
MRTAILAAAAAAAAAAVVIVIVIVLTLTLAAQAAPAPAPEGFGGPFKARPVADGHATIDQHPSADSPTSPLLVRRPRGVYRSVPRQSRPIVYSIARRH